MESTNCSNCEKSIERYPSEIRENNFCSNKCVNLWHTKDNNHAWDNGKEETDCTICGSEFKYYESQRTGKYCSSECVYESQRREKYNKPKRFYNRMAWDKTRQKIKERDSFECQWCSGGGENMSLHVHHLRPIEFGGDKHNPSNLVTLCNRCHGLAHNAIDYQNG